MRSRTRVISVDQRLDQPVRLRSGLILSERGKSKDQRTSAFTLIEMMIVIVVIAILLGVLLPNFRGTQDEANTQRARSELRTLATALESYYIHNSNAYPSALASLTSVTPLIVSRIPSDPFNGSTAYQYATSSGYYVVWSIGPNRTAGITGVNSSGALTGTQGDDICVTNGTATTC